METSTMPYSAEISRVNPSCFMFLIDQSGSMNQPFGESDTGSSKADELASAINRLLSILVIKCSRDEEIRRYFQVGVIGYGGNGVRPALSGNLSGQPLVWIDDIYRNPARVEDRIRKVSDGAGGLIETTTKFPVWVDAAGNGGTPMCEAFSLAHTTLRNWVDQYETSFPPVVIHITDGASTDGDPSTIAKAIQELRTSDGNVLLLNLHLSTNRAPTIQFPSTPDRLPDEFARLLFSISSLLPDYMQAEARNMGYSVDDDSRGFVFNAGIEDVISFLTIGTKPSNMR
jgi:hypothetical protein